MMSSYDRVRDALGFIPANDRDTWVRMGMAVKAELGEPGFDIWDTWSQSGESYNARDAKDVWKSIRAGGAVTGGTLFHEAKAYGWANGSHAAPSPEEVAERKRVAAERAAREEAETARQHDAAATEAAKTWASAIGASPDHAYLERKGIKPHGARAIPGKLVIPVRNAAGELRSLQFIDGSGNKRFLPDGEVKGCYYAIGKPNGVLCIAEGFATGASIHEATGHAVAIAFTAGNLMAVAQALRAKYPELRIILCADDDYRGERQ